MEEYDFSSLFERSDGDYAGSILERLFGGIVPFLQTGDSAALGTGNWLSTIFGIFNAAGMLAVMIVISYTVYTAIFDTAADGKSFGEQTNTRYTIVRTLLGFCAFVPVAGGYSLIQVVMLWIVIQGSALADVTWARTADVALSGQPLLAAPQNSSQNTFVMQQQFGAAFDALVTGHICAINANSISQTLSGGGSESNPPPDPTSGPLVVHSTPSSEARTSSNWLGIGGRQTATLNHVLRFQEAEGSTAYSGRQNFCGGVANSATLQQGGDGYSFAEQVASVRVRSQFENYISTINQLSNSAQTLALSIHNGLRDVPAIQEASRTAIRAATNGYASGARSNFSFSTDETAQMHEHLLDSATERGWLFAPAWQRGISMGASWYDSPDGDLRINAHRENNVAAFLAGYGLRSGPFGDSTTRAMLAKAEDDERVWGMAASYIRNLGDVEAQTEDESYQGLTTGGADVPAWINWLYTNLLNLFNPVSSPTGNSGYVDPMVQVSQQGKYLLGVGTLIAAPGAVISFGSAIWGVGGAFETVGGFMTTVGVSLMGLGFIIGTIVPMIPLIFFYSAVLSWILLVVESMFAVSLAVLSLFAPSREGQLIGSWNRILLSIFGIFFRPFFTVVGLIFAMMVISFALQYLYDIFYMLMDFMLPGTGVWAVVSLLGFLAVYVLVTTLTVILGAQFVTELGDGALNWLGVTFGSISNRMNVGETVANSTVGRGLPARMNPALGGKLSAANSRGIANRAAGRERDRESERQRMIPHK